MKTTDIIESRNTAEQKLIHKSNKHSLTGLLVVTLLLVGVAATNTLLPHLQDIRQHAAVDCGTSLQSKIDVAVSGETVDLTGCSYNGSANITKPMTLIGGTLNSPTGDAWAPSISITSDNVTIQNWQFTGGGVVISILGHSNVNILNNTFAGEVNSAIAIWGEGRGSNNVIIDGNTITQTNTNKVSPIIGRASEDCSVYSKNTIFRNNKIDQGEGTLGWFGVELKCHDGVIFENNYFHGGEVLVSLPDTNNVNLSNNTFDMKGSGYWGIEVAHANNVNVSGNTFVGDGPTGNDHAVSLNSGSMYTNINGNNASDIRTLVDVGGNYISITNNCLSNVLRVTEFDSSGTNVTLSNNGPCTLTPTSIIPPTGTATPTATKTPTPTIMPTSGSGDTQTPIVSLTSPIAGSIVKIRSNVNIAATATDNVGVARVEFRIGTTLTCTDTTSPYNCTWKVPGSKNKAYTISAKAYDAAGNSSNASISVTAK